MTAEHTDALFCTSIGTAADGIGGIIHDLTKRKKLSDTGPGLSEEVASRLFRSFATTKESGIGVGLTICQSIVEAHNGGLWAPPNKDGGVEFRFRWPVAELE